MSESRHQPRSSVSRTPSPDAPALAPLTAEALRGGLRCEELVLHHQPVVDLGTGRVRGVEALVRWQHPERGLVLPLELLPLAEESGLVVDLGEWVLRAGAAQAAAWSAAGRTLDVAINLSPLQMIEPGFADRVCTILAEAGAPAERVVLEVTESALMDRPQATEALEQLHAAGVRLAIDDFGTGYSCFSYLRRFPIDVIKIDQSFVAGLGRYRDDDAIVASVVELAHRTGKSVVAEGVETTAQVGLLQDLGVESAQGFLWARPLPPDRLEPWLEAFALRPSFAASPRPEPTGVVTPQTGPEADRILELHADGASPISIAAALNGAGMRTTSGVRWHPTTVAKVLAERRARTPS